jgi:hypothetical protein
MNSITPPKDKSRDDYVIVCRNPKCKYRYPIPSNNDLVWKIQKFRGVCGHGDAKIFPEITEPVPCPECGERSYRIIPKEFLSKTGKNCSI